MALTAIQIRNAKPKAKTHKLFDGNGLYLEISPNGGKWWRLKYRYDGKEKRLSLGVYPEVSLKQARQNRDHCRKQLAEGIDPSQHRKATKAARKQATANSFEVIAREWFERHKSGWAPAHAERQISRLDRHILPWLGNKPIACITAPELLQVLRRIEDRGTIETAHRTKGICGQVFRYAIATGRAERDISADLRGAIPPAKKSHFPSVTDPKKVSEILQVLDGYDGTFCSTKRPAHRSFSIRAPW